MTIERHTSTSTARTKHGDTLLDSVVAALNTIEDSAARRIVLAALREGVPQVRWFVGTNGLISAVAV